MPWDFWLIFFALGMLLPWRGRARLRKLAAIVKVSGGQRISLYLSTIAFQWLMAGVVVWRASAHGLGRTALGFVAQPRAGIVIASIVGGATLGLFQWLNVRRVGRLPVAARGFAQPLAERILPQSLLELIPFLALAVTAGVCEEILYRGFTMAVLTWAGIPVWGVILLSASLFGLAHLYQGRGGVLGTSVLGIGFGLMRIAYDSVVPMMVWHATVDVVAGLAGRRYLVAKTAEVPESHV